MFYAEYLFIQKDNNWKDILCFNNYIITYKILIKKSIIEHIKFLNRICFIKSKIYKYYIFFIW
jgi:hypothetical protein